MVKNVMDKLVKGGYSMKPDDSGKRNYGDPADVMLLLAKEADDVIALAGKSARQEAEEETEKMLRQYEQRAKQIVLKIREETRARADEMAVRFRDALILMVEEASTAALDETIAGVGVKTGEIVKHMQEAVKKETRQALAEGLVAGDDKSRSTRAQREEDSSLNTEKPQAEKISSAGEEGKLPPRAAEDFEKWLMP
jgi:hypothetical protein